MSGSVKVLSVCDLHGSCGTCNTELLSEAIVRWCAWIGEMTACEFELAAVELGTVVRRVDRAQFTPHPPHEQPRVPPSLLPADSRAPSTTQHSNFETTR